MPHFQYIRLKPHKGVKQGTLSELGRINVVCGPNNSGKTTILECIANSKLHSFGKKLDENSTKRIDAVSMENKHWNQQQFADAYPKLLIEAASKQAAWYHDEADRFWGVILEIWQKSFRGSTPGNPADLSKGYRAEFSGAPSVSLIPAKRRLETSKRVDAFDHLRPDGEGILNYLFNAKNQDESSEKRKQFDAISAAFHEISAGFEFNVFIWEKDPTTVLHRQMWN